MNSYCKECVWYSNAHTSYNHGLENIEYCYRSAWEIGIKLTSDEMKMWNNHLDAVPLTSQVLAKCQLLDYRTVIAI